MTIDQGGSAYPYSFTTAFGEDVYDSGMTLRDWFAGQAMTGLAMAAYSMMTEERTPEVEDEIKQGMAIVAYKLADALLRMRSKS